MPVSHSALGTTAAAHSSEASSIQLAGWLNGISKLDAISRHMICGSESHCGPSSRDQQATVAWIWRSCGASPPARCACAGEGHFPSCFCKSTKWGSQSTQVGRQLARTLSARWSAEHRTDSCILKVDFANAFNVHDRQQMLLQVAAKFPDALWYAVAAYGSPSHLVFGEHFLSSRSGVQQGDPLGPALFSLHLASVWRKAKQDEPLDLHVWYLDDGTICGRRDSVRTVFSRLQGNSQGFRVNPAKCEIISGDSAADRLVFPELSTFRSFGDWSLLGVPCGDLPSCDALTSRQIAAASAKTHIIATCPDPHVGYALLRYCGSYGLTVHVARYGGDPALLRPFDSEVTGEQFAVPLPADSWKQARLPLRRGGLGLRSAADHAAVAAVASAIGTSFQAPALGHRFLLEDDPLAARALRNLPVATVSGLSASVEEARRLVGYVPHLQRQFSSILDDAAASLLQAALDQTSMAPVSSASGRHASGWLAWSHSELDLCRASGRASTEKVLVYRHFWRELSLCTDVRIPLHTTPHTQQRWNEGRRNTLTMGNTLAGKYTRDRENTCGKRQMHDGLACINPASAHLVE